MYVGGCDVRCDDVMCDVEAPRRIGRDVMATQSEDVGIQLAFLTEAQAADVKRLFSEAIRFLSATEGAEAESVVVAQQ
eukprot:5229213-Pyramimonas_sp.AAC.1